MCRVRLPGGCRDWSLRCGRTQPQPWSAPLSRELLVFNSFVRSLTRALRTLLEVTSLNMLRRHDARRARDDLLDVNLSLPFQNEVNTGFGVLAKVYLDALTHLNGQRRVRDPNAEGVREAKQVALDICEETFQGVKYPKAEVERGFRFWDVVSAVSALLLLFLRWNRMLTVVLSPFHSVTLGSVPVRCASASAPALLKNSVSAVAVRNGGSRR